MFTTIVKLVPTVTYARNTPGAICQYKEDGLVSRPPSLFTSMRRPIHGTSCPKSQLKSTCLTAKFWSFSDHTETGEKGQNVISSSVQHPISLIFAIHVSLIIPLPMMWILLTKPMQKSVTTVCLHCSFARLKNKHIGVLGTNVATMSWLHWSPVLGITVTQSHTGLHDRPIESSTYSALSPVLSTNVVCVKTQQKHDRIKHHDRTKQ